MLSALLRVICFLLFFEPSTPAKVQVCKDIHEGCAKCVESYYLFLGFKEYCRWCVHSNTCGGPISCRLGEPFVSRHLSNCPVQHASELGHRYTDRLGRSVYAIALAAKSNNPEMCLRNSRPDITEVKQFYGECDVAKNTCTAIVAISEAAKAIYVAYRGSTLKQFLPEFIYGLAAQIGVWEPFEVEGAGVIIYFHNAFRRLFLEKGIKDELLRLHEKYPNYRLWITGHSLGGSLASMTALYLAFNNLVKKEKIRLITYGEPRTGNVGYAEALEREVPFRYRVIKRNDFASNLPVAIDPNDGLLLKPQIAKQPRYYRYLVHYNNEMTRSDNFEICDLADDHHCRNLAMANNYFDHVTYFNFNQDDYLKQNCTRSMLL